ncbi:PSD1 and planctomycete cytochrome C domain-containing protein [Anatilimnocola floriformis]|uniref:PSD1 and planctomycete cytochrome C domain-containing protein n=1 Tax=Anatilimnocola floriformis TaxID=2948575 RepID=UPI0020C2A2B2|nr:PSD1 and planctomycete cytochrome C domain-containing protein [Anatilimnocola floriformis]
MKLPTVGIALALLLTALVAARGQQKIDYNRQIKPILSDRCYRCHGPDAGERKGGFRLDQRDSAVGAAESGGKPIVPGKPEESELLKRIHETDAELVMPPPSLNKKLSADEKKLLRDWIAAGADFQQHWAFVTPKKPALPVVKDASAVRNPIDLFLQAKREQLGMTSTQFAPKDVLLRRLSFDLIGLPPTIAEVDAFLANRSPDAYEQQVDRLLSSPYYGERLAVDWLDASRFADTHGFHIDSGRDMTRWREYVIESFNQNVPYNQFTLEQLAGDLLPSTGDETRDLRQKIASGFNRNHMINFEGGAIPQEYLTAYIIDRVNTTSTVYLGLTVGCSQCHDHKYDPITQKDFYQLYAFFNAVPESGLDGSKGNAAPFLKTPTKLQQAETARITARMQAIQQQLASELPAADAEQVKWEKTAASADNIVKWDFADRVEAKSRGGANFKTLEDKSLLTSGPSAATELLEFTWYASSPLVTAVRVDALADPSFPAKGPGRSQNGNFVLTGVKIEAADGSGEFATKKIRRASADFEQDTFPIANAIDSKAGSGWAIFPQVGKDHFAIFELAEPIKSSEGPRLKVTLQFDSQFAQHQMGRVRISSTEAEKPIGAEAMPAKIATLLPKARDARSAAEQQELTTYFRQNVSASLRPLRDELAALKSQQTQIETSIPTTMVMQEAQPRPTYLLMRGQYDKPDKNQELKANVPGFLSPLPADSPQNRLGLAKWLIDPQHPLMSRVTVNRYWQMIFGTGLVKTADDFGSQGEQPSHPELLDYLATDFVGASSSGETRWDVKRLVRDLVTSAAYLQSSSAASESRGRDPENRFLSRGPRFRLQAEFIRDQALFAGGLLDRRIGGQSVSPYQPAGLWEELMSRSDNDKWTAQKYKQSHGVDLYRRTMYTFWKRTCPPASLATFDAPDREVCTVKRSRTNTPLQALVTLNDPTYVEASRQFAERILRSGKTVDERIDYLFRTVMTRPPTAAEIAVIKNLYTRQLVHFQQNPAAAAKLLKVGEVSLDESLNADELAAWTMTASAVLNTDEALTKG